jgi:L-serine dehydratase
MKKEQRPSIFNDVIGPVMRGPSSSHTAASHRIGTIIRQFCLPENGKVLVEFDRNGSLATTYEGQGTAMGLISGLLGLSILDPSIVRYNDLAKEANLNIQFLITDFESSHPNTYRITVENEMLGTFSFTALSTGGGMIEFIKVNSFNVSVRGDYFETFICLLSHSADEIKLLFDILSNRTNHSRIFIYQNGNNDFLINIKSREPILSVVEGIIDDHKDVIWIRQIDPVMPILSGVMLDLPFGSIDEMMSLADKEGYDLSQLAVLYESSLAGIEPQKVLSIMKEIVLKIQNSISEGLKGTNYRDRILGYQSNLILEAEKEKKIIPTILNKVIAYVTALMEVKSSMGIIVAAPTAGSSGVLGGVILAVAEELSEDIESVTKAFMAAGIIGVFIADKYTFAAEEGGCQVECGAASGMAAAGLVQLMGGTARQAINASSMALQNILGMICDPVADRVEVPCLGKNIIGATNALNSANMSIAGFDHVIPLDEVIDAMKSVGDIMPSSLCCTGLGGLSVTPTAKRLFEEMHKNKQALPK